MLWTIAVVLFVLWILGLVAFHTIGALVHLFLIVAVIVVIVRLVSGGGGS